MRRTSLALAAILATLLTAVMTHPVPEVNQDAEAVQKAKAALIEKLETDLVKAAALGGIAEAVKMEQKFEEQILNVAVKTLMRDRGNPEKQARDMEALNELVRRDKRAVELLTGVLGSSSGGGDGSSSGGGGSGGLISGLLGGSSGGSNTDGDGGDSGGGSNLLSLVSGLLGSSSGGGGDSDDGGGGSNLLSLIPSLLGSSSGGGGDGDSGGGGGSNALSLVSGILGSSSGGGTSDAGSSSSSGGGFRPLGNVFDQKLNLLNVGGGDAVLKGGTYDDLIGKSGSSNFIGAITNTVSAVLRAKFNIFKSLFSSLTGGLLGRLGGGAATT